MAEAEDASLTAYKETVRRRNAEKEAIEAIRKVIIWLLSAYFTSSIRR